MSGLQLSLSLSLLACDDPRLRGFSTSDSALTGQTLGANQFMGRWSNIDPNTVGFGQGYRALGLTSGDADHLFWSYSTLFVGGPDQLGCSGTFVAPNVLLGAGHCGHAGFAGSGPAGFQSLLYREGDPSGVDPTQGEDAWYRIVNSCETLVQNNSSGDFHFYYCEDICMEEGGISRTWGTARQSCPAGTRPMAPGELFGMGDFDFAPGERW
ncbi:MAG: hypothetical protein HC923_03180 [Myxococcales bacterium]|nr:hypothetical protein [Myxococcales bacterium]